MTSSRQFDLFSDPAPAPKRCCGTCVARNAIDEAEEYGGCARAGRRHRDDAPCAAWFGLAQLRAPLYGQGRGR